MLPKLATINESRKLVFILATNYIGGFDAAFSQGGRFDVLVQVMPPTVDAKVGNDKSPGLQRAWATLSAEQRGELGPILSDLTYPECAELDERLRSLASADGAASAIKTAQAHGILAQQNQIDPSGAMRTWKDTCQAERKHLRGIE